MTFNGVQQELKATGRHIFLMRLLDATCHTQLETTRGKIVLHSLSIPTTRHESTFRKTAPNGGGHSWDVLIWPFLLPSSKKIQEFTRVFQREFHATHEKILGDLRSND